MSDSITIPDWLTLWFPVRPVGSVMFLKQRFTVLIHLIHLGLKSFFFIKIAYFHNFQRIIIVLASLFLNDKRKLKSEDSKIVIKECVEIVKYKR
jgi:hypothetical protein